MYLCPRLGVLYVRVSAHHIQLNLLKIWIGIKHGLTVLQLLIVAGVRLNLAESSRCLQPDQGMHLILTFHDLCQWVEKSPITQKCEDKDALTNIEILDPSRLEQSAHLEHSFDTLISCLAQWAIRLVHPTHLRQVTSSIGLLKDALEKRTVSVSGLWVLDGGWVHHSKLFLALLRSSDLLSLLLLLVLVKVVFDKWRLLTLHVLLTSRLISCFPGWQLLQLVSLNHFLTLTCL
mgnify:CR=1 FL=1